MSKRKLAVASKLGAKKSSSVVKKSKAAAGKATSLAGKASEAAQRVATAAQGAAATAATTAQGAATAGVQAVQKVRKPLRRYAEHEVQSRRQRYLHSSMLCPSTCTSWLAYRLRISGSSP